MLAGFAKASILGHISHGIIPFSWQTQPPFSLARNMPINECGRTFFPTNDYNCLWESWNMFSFHFDDTTGDADYFIYIAGNNMYQHKIQAMSLCIFLLLNQASEGVPLSMTSLSFCKNPSPFSGMLGARNDIRCVVDGAFMCRR
jgi:hypothetical protein